MTKKNKRKLQALSRARDWPGNIEMVRRAVKEAAEISPITEMQWYNLRVVHGPYAIHELQKMLGADQS